MGVKWGGIYRATQCRRQMIGEGNKIKIKISHLKLMQYSRPRFQVMWMTSESRVNGMQRPASRMSLTERFINR